MAKLAGLPAAVIERAKVVLAKLESEDRAAPRGFDDLPLFAAAPRPASGPPRDAAVDTVIAALAALHPDEMSPRDALEALYALKAKAASQGSIRSIAAAAGVREETMTKFPAALLSLGCLLAASAAQAQSYPSRRSR